MNQQQVTDFVKLSFQGFLLLEYKGWTEIKKYGKISIKNDARKSGVDGEYLL